MSVEDTIKDCINYLNEDVCNKSFLTYEEEREWEDYITRLINNSNKEKDKEIERLNNIINELEKYFEQEGFWHSLDKIKELKGEE